MYNIDYSYVKKGIYFYSIFLFSGIFLLVLPYELKYNFGEDNNFILKIILPLFSMLFLFLGGINIIKTCKRIKRIKKLNNVGKLYKNIPYHLEDTGGKIGNNVIVKPVIEFICDNGIRKVLAGDARFDFKINDNDGFIDMIIDLDDMTNYFMDYEINRIGGNREDDYYKHADGKVSNISIESSINPEDPM